MKTTDRVASVAREEADQSVAGRRVGAGVLVVAPTLLLAAELISPINTSSDTAEEWYADVVAEPGRYSITALCLLAGLLTMVPATLQMRHEVPAARRSTATVGAVLAATGFMLWAVNLGAVGVGVTAWTSVSDAQVADALPVFVAMDEGEGLMPIVQLGALLPVIGLTVMAVALWRWSSYPRWAAVALPLGFAVLLFTPFNVGRAVGAALLLTAMLPKARDALRSDNHQFGSSSQEF